jgi:carbamoyl-phosphate synthase small subunit
MVGYPETLTDPSYRGQILAFTYPLLGNYGVPDVRRQDRFESDRVQVSAVLVASLSHDSHHWTATRSLDAWLREEGIPGLAGLDTRALTKRLRSEGTVSGKILVDADRSGTITEASPFPDISTRNLVADVSVKEPILHGEGRRRVVLVDCGAKRNIVRCLVGRGVSVLQVPWDHDINAEDADAIFVSNGPGDPKRAVATIEHLREALSGSRPIFGICLGSQLLGLAAGCDTYKLPFGHRSQNQPCREVGTERCYITSQNHGYAIDARSLPEDWREWFVNANDGSNEGIRHCDKPFRAVQFHPEAKPGPEDTAFLFDRFVDSL